MPKSTACIIALCTEATFTYCGKVNFVVQMYKGRTPNQHSTRRLFKVHMRYFDTGMHIIISVVEAGDQFSLSSDKSKTR